MAWYCLRCSTKQETDLGKPYADRVCGSCNWHPGEVAGRKKNREQAKLGENPSTERAVKSTETVGAGVE